MSGYDSKLREVGEITCRAEGKSTSWNQWVVRFIWVEGLTGVYGTDRAEEAVAGILFTCTVQDVSHVPDRTFEGVYPHTLERNS